MTTLSPRLRIKIKYTAFALLMALLIFALIERSGGFYNDPLAEIIAISESSPGEQHITARLLNTSLVNESIFLTNTYHPSEAITDRYTVGQHIFVVDYNGTYHIKTLRRDSTLILLVMVCVIIILSIGGKKGLRSLLSLGVNFIIVLLMLRLYMDDVNLYIIVPLCMLLFITTSLILVCGLNKKSFAAGVGTIIGSFVTVAIAYAVFALTKKDGLHYQEIELAIRSPIDLFYIQLTIGTLGAIMDIAVSIASSIEEIVTTSPRVRVKALAKSGIIIGKDTMGTMTNTLMLAYLSGGLPLMLLLLKNNISTGFIINVTLSMEILRAVIGSIGIVLSIPITLFFSILLYRKEVTHE